MAKAHAQTFLHGVFPFFLAGHETSFELSGEASLSRVYATASGKTSILGAIFYGYREEGPVAPKNW